MAEFHNSVPKGFLKTYRVGDPDTISMIPLSTGFLKVEYGYNEDPSLLSLVSFVLEQGEYAPAVGMRLELMLTRECECDIVTWVTENGMSGLQWSDGEVVLERSFDDDEAPPGEPSKIGLDEWIDECLEHMVNPTDEELAEYREANEG